MSDTEKGQNRLICRYQKDLPAIYMNEQIIVCLPYSLLRLICLVIQGLEVCPSTSIHLCLIRVIDGSIDAGEFDNDFKNGI